MSATKFACDERSMYLRVKKDVALQDMSDVCVGTSVGTITEPECLGPCEPGTSVTLEGIVWHETEGGKFFARFKIGREFD